MRASVFNAAREKRGACTSRAVGSEFSRLDGISVTRLLKSDPRTQCIPIIILTAYPHEATDGSALETGADIFLTKPCLPEYLETRPRRFCGAERGSNPESYASVVSNSTRDWAFDRARIMHATIDRMINEKPKIRLSFDDEKVQLCPGSCFGGVPMTRERERGHEQPTVSQWCVRDPVLR